MSFSVVVNVRGANEQIFSPPFPQRDEAEQQLTVIRGVLNTAIPVDLPWLAVTGQDIVSAHVIENSY